MLIWLLSWLAIVVTIVFFLSGIITCREMLAKKSTDKVPFLPFMTTLMNCSLWDTYGLLKGDSTLMVVNSVGVILQVLYILCFLYVSKEKVSQLRIITYASIAGFVVYMYIVHVITEDGTRTAHLGKLCIVVTITMQASPMATMADVVRTKSTESMTFIFSLMITIVSFIWMCYGMAINDVNIQIPNGTGVVLGSIQLVLFCIYPSSPFKGGRMASI